MILASRIRTTSIKIVASRSSRLGSWATEWHGRSRKCTERGSVVLVLSAAVLVIVIDARAGGMWLARVGGSRKGAKLAKWLGARGISPRSREGTKLRRWFGPRPIARDSKDVLGNTEPQRTQRGRVLFAVSAKSNGDRTITWHSIRGQNLARHPQKNFASSALRVKPGARQP